MYLHIPQVVAIYCFGDEGPQASQEVLRSVEQSVSEKKGMAQCKVIKKQMNFFL
jgi:hypothetical protein